MRLFILILVVVFATGCSSEHERGKNAKDANAGADRPVIVRPEKEKK